jgi:hypothetical protein
MSETPSQPHQPYRNMLLEVESEEPSEGLDAGNRMFVTIIGVSIVAAVLLAMILAL